MRRTLIAVATALVVPLAMALGAGVAQAHDRNGPWLGGDHGQQTPLVAVAGTVVSVDQSAGTFVANAFVPAGEGPGFGFGHHHGDQGDQGRGGGGDQGGGSGGGDQGGGGAFHDDWGQGFGDEPTPTTTTTQVTITTNSSTAFRLNGQTGTIADLAAGDRFVALFTAPTTSTAPTMSTAWLSPTGSQASLLQTLVATPAVAVFAHTPPMAKQLYAFVGTVTGTNTTAGTVSVTVSSSFPSGFFPAASNPATFTVSADTLFLGGTATNGLFGGGLADVATGDVVAGGLVGTAGETVAQVEVSPLAVLVDFPASTTSTMSATVRHEVRQRALNQALALFGVKKAAKSHKHAKRSKTSHAKTRATRK
jgi:hypothetical protein